MKIWRTIETAKLAKKIPQRTPIKSHKSKSIGIVGFFNLPIGIANAAILLKSELLLNGLEVHEIDASKLLNNNNKIDAINAIIREDIDTLIIAVNPDLAMSILDAIGSGQFIGKKLIGHWVWELEQPPKYWKLLENFVHEIWTPSEFSKKALERIYDVPIRVVKHPVALMDIPLAPKDIHASIRQKHSISQSTFIAFQSLDFSSSLERKNTLEAIDIFAEAFGDIEDAKFIVRYSGCADYPKSLEKLRAAKAKHPDKIIIFESSKNKSELFDYYRAADLYLSLHRSEGFGLNIAEAMLIGLPVMVTNWSGNLEFCKEENSLLVDFELIKVSDSEGIYDANSGNWAKVIKNDAVEKLRLFYNDIKLRDNLINRGPIAIKECLSAEKLL